MGLKDQLSMGPDNQSVLHAIVGGGAQAPEVNAVVRNFGKLVVAAESAIKGGRVESRANLADGQPRTF